MKIYTIIKSARTKNLTLQQRKTIKIDGNNQNVVKWQKNNVERS